MDHKVIALYSRTSYFLSNYKKYYVADKLKMMDNQINFTLIAIL